MKIIFMGTPNFSCPALLSLIKNHDVLAILTQPDRPKGRGHKLTASPVKLLGESNNIPVYQPESLHIGVSKELRKILKALNPDVFIVVAYGLLLPKGFLEMPKFGAINIHASLLPMYRGAAPIHATLLKGDTKTGITIIKMDTGLDTGDIIYKEEIDIKPLERFESLYNRLADLGAICILKAINMIETSNVIYIKQDNSIATYAPMIKKSDMQIDWNKTTDEIINMIRAYESPFFIYNNQNIKIWDAEKINEVSTSPPSTILKAKGSLYVKTGDGILSIKEIQAPNTKRMGILDFLRGRAIV